MTENFTFLVKDKDLQFGGARQTPVSVKRQKIRASTYHNQTVAS